MVRLVRERCPAPAELTKRQTEWTSRWRGIYELGCGTDWAAPAAKRGLRDCLIALTHGKCAYCENTLDAVEIDHYIPKTTDIEKVFEWSNLFPVCGPCNRAKGNSNHRGALLKPDEEDPEPYFSIGPNGQLEPRPTLDNTSMNRARMTIQICKLTRGGLQQSRVRIRKIISCLLQNPSEETINLILDPTWPFKLVLRQILESIGCPDLAAEDRRRFEKPPDS